MRNRQEPWWLPKGKAPSDPLHLPFIVSGCDSNSFAAFGLFRKLFWFLSPENFFPLHPSLLPTTTLWGCHVSVFHVKKSGKSIQAKWKDNITESEVNWVCLTVLAQDFCRLENFSSVKGLSACGLVGYETEWLFILKHSSAQPTYQHCFNGSDKNLYSFFMLHMGLSLGEVLHVY